MRQTLSLQTLDNRTLDYDKEIHMSTASATEIDPKLLEILVCPVTKGPLRYDREKQELISEKAGLAYPIRDGIPIMLADEAREIDSVNHTKPVLEE